MSNDITNKILQVAKQLATPLGDDQRQAVLQLPYGKAWLQTYESLGVFNCLGIASKQVKGGLSAK